MVHTKIFRFKKFFIHQSEKVFKVGTDGVLLGAWTNLENVNSVLEIGTGTGLISLMVAQRSNARIHAIEIDQDAFNLAWKNFSQSPWSERIQARHTSFTSFAESASEKYDLIITNPPFFLNSQKPVTMHKSVARHAESLPFEDIARHTHSLLNPQGRLSIILPVVEGEQFIRTAERNDLFLRRITRVNPTVNKGPNRYLMEFTKRSCDVEESSLIIRDECNQLNFTEEYKKLTTEFHPMF